ncbi:MULTISPECIES: hypothetical protein [unclassified Streptomyces]|uniref:hypothetical protein n=1 Tax=unclassified Streptomyces TaxID=2593676 RepID=UPI0034102DA8
MVRMSHVIDVEQVPRLWFEQVIHSFYELANRTRTEAECVLLPDGRPLPSLKLVDGQHLSPGAVYETHDDDAKMLCTVRRWDRMRGAHVGMTTSDGQLIMALDGRTTAVERPPARSPCAMLSVPKAANAGG